MINVGSQQSPQLIYFGTDARRNDPSRFVVPIEVLAGLFFVLIALVFVGPGQELGRRFSAVENRVAGLYSRYPWQLDRHRGLRRVVLLVATSAGLVRVGHDDRPPVCPAQAASEHSLRSSDPGGRVADSTGPGTVRAWKPRSPGHPITR